MFAARERFNAATYLGNAALNCPSTTFPLRSNLSCMLRTAARVLFMRLFISPRGKDPPSCAWTRYVIWQTEGHTHTVSKGAHSHNMCDQGGQEVVVRVGRFDPSVSPLAYLRGRGEQCARSLSPCRGWPRQRQRQTREHC